MQIMLIAAALLATVGANAAGLPCSIHPRKGTADFDLPALATVSRAVAQGTALKAVNVRSASVESGELEAEAGCLIYSFDIRIPGRKSIVEVLIDAGTGRVLSKKYEGPKAQAAEHTADAAAATKK